MTSNALEERQYTFTVGTPARLKLRNIRGQVHLEPGDEGVVTVAAVKHRNSGNADRTHVEVSQADDGQVTVETRFAGHDMGRWFFGLRQPCLVDYTVRLPRHCVLDVGVVNCPTRIHGLEGELVLQTVSGDVHLSDLAGSLHLDCVSGDVLGQRLRLAKPLEVKTVSGAIVLVESVLPAVNANTVSGAIRLQTPLGAGPYQFKSVSGDVDLTAPPDSACQIELRALSGQLRCAFPLAQYHVTGGYGPHGQVHARVGLAGGPLVQMHSLSGDLCLRMAEADTTSAPSRTEILDRLARGELTVEQALGALRA